MKKTARLFVLIPFFLGLAACEAAFTFPQTQTSPEIVKPANTISAALSQTASALVPTASQTPASAGTGAQSGPTPVPTQAFVFSPIPQAADANPSFTATPWPPCDIAQAGRPIDVTIPDDTRLGPGELFSKTWRLVNAGTCTWSHDYTVVWFSGDDLGVTRAQGFAGEVPPGGSIDVTVDMIAPLEAGSYQSNWKLRGTSGDLFGIGPNGDSPFWVRIIVVIPDTPTPTFTPIPPEPTATPVIFTVGRLVIRVDESADLDTGELEEDEHADLAVQQSPQGALFLEPRNGAKLVYFGTQMPSLVQCAAIPPADGPIDLSQIARGAYLCYRTTNGLPGQLTIGELDAVNKQVSLEFLTWAVP